MFSLLRADDFFCCLDVLYGGISNCNFLSKLDSDPDLKSMNPDMKYMNPDTDLESMNPDPKKSYK
jgi:hypothetical protein